MSQFKMQFAIIWCCVTTMAATAEPQGLQAQWKFDEGKGTVARDSSGNDRDVTLHGASWVKQAGGFAVSLDGVDDYIDFNKGQPLGLTGPVSLEVWVKPTGETKGLACLLGQDLHSYLLGFSGKGHCYWYIGRGTNHLGAIVKINQWNHIAATFDGERMTLWLNGRHAAERESTTKSYDKRDWFRIATKGRPDLSHFRGMLDNVRLYSRALTEQQIVDHVTKEAGDYGITIPPKHAAVLHYTFDKDTGDIAKDISGYGNDGKIINAKYLDQFDGRQGVLRFDGEQSKLECPNYESLRFSGDMSFEMWVRRNGPVKNGSGMLFGDRSNFGFFMGYWHVLSFFYSGFNVQLNASENMIVPVERSIISDKWSHIAVVAAYPRIRFYHDGKLIRDAYMPHPGINKRHNVVSWIGGWKDRSAPIDVDEFRFYRRALSATEVAAHAREEIVQAGQEWELTIEPRWYEDTIAVRLSCQGMNYTNHTADISLRQGGNTQKIELKETSRDSGRYATTAIFPLKDMAGKTVNVAARIMDSKSALIHTVRKKYSIIKPQWVHSREGHSNEVLAPWTPVQTSKISDNKIEVRVWGRRYIFGNTPFTQQIETRGEQLLTSPISLKGRISGNDITWQRGRVDVKHTSQTAASLLQYFDNQHATLRINTTIEYDGYMIFDCTIKAKRDLNIESLRLEIPLRTRYASLCFGSYVYPEKTKPRIPMSTMHIGAVRGDLAFRFSPNIWLGDEQLGLSWQAESDQDWRIADQQKAIEILPRDKTTIFRANWVSAPSKLIAGQTLHYRFALQATPVKQLMRDAWDLRVVRCEPYGRALSVPDEKIDGKPAIQFYSESGMRRLFTTECDMWPHPTPVHQPYMRLLRRLNDQLHAAGIQHHGYQIHERFAAMAPEFDIHGLHMSNRPMRTYDPGPHSPPGQSRPGPVGMIYGADSQGTVAFCAQSMALQDACVDAVAKRMDKYGGDGVYLDGTAVHMKTCRNTMHGCGYRAEDGSIRGTYPMFASRQFIKRIYTVVKQRKPDGIVDVHSWHFNPGSLAYGDMLWTGEQWWHRRHKKEPHIPSELTLDIFRTAFTGRQLGIAAEMLAYRLGPPMKVSAITLLHDIPVRPSTPGFDREKDSKVVPRPASYFEIIVKLWKMRDQFGAHQAEKLFYWNNQDYVTVSPQECYATLMKHPANGVLAYITNLRRDAASVNLQLNLDKLGLANKKLEAFNALTGLPVSMTDDGKLSVQLSSQEWVYIWLRPVVREKH